MILYRAGFVPRNLDTWGANATTAPWDPKFFEGEFFFTHLCTTDMTSIRGETRLDHNYLS